MLLILVAFYSQRAPKGSQMGPKVVAKMDLKSTKIELNVDHGDAKITQKTEGVREKVEKKRRSTPGIHVFFFNFFKVVF